MSRDELVNRYLDGQISRRVFIRKLVASGVSVFAALSYAEVLKAAPAYAVLGDFYILVGDFYFSPGLATPVQRGQRVRWGFSYLNSYSHSATDGTGMGYFDSGYRAPNTVFTKTFIAAGTYPYKCKDLSHVPMTGTIKVPVGALPASAALGTTFTITWASATAPLGFVYDVQIKFPGATSFTAWRTGVTYKSTTFTPGRRGDFFFRARLRRTSNGRASGYSNPKKIRVT